MSALPKDLASHRESSKKKGMWIYTFKGNQFYALDPHPEDIDIQDIAHATALTCRYSGHCNTFYSVAQHSVILSKNVSKEHALSALLHDSAEAYMTDIPRPIKYMLGEEFREIEDHIYRVIAEKFGAEHPLPEEVHKLDHNIVHDEAKVLFDIPPEWISLYEPTGINIQPVGWRQAETMFLKRFEELTK